MKMNLSVVMQTVDKMTAPLKNINANQDHFNKKIEAAKAGLKDNTATLAKVQSLQKLQAQNDATSAAMRAQQERIDKLNQAKKANGKLTAAQEQQLLSAQQKMGKLTDQQKAQTTETNKVNAALKKSGVDTKNLAKESDRLGREYSKKEKQLGALTSRFERLKRASAWSAKAHGMIRLPSMGQIKGAAMGIAGLGATMAGYFRIISGQAGTMDALQKQADTLKMPIQELQALHSQAEHAGLSSDQMTGSLQNLTKTLGNLQTHGGGKLAQFLKKTRNPLFKELKDAESTEEAYEKVVDAFGKLKSEQEQMAFADAAFGGNSKEMLLMLREGTEGLTGAREEFMALGGGIKEKDARSAEAFNDSWQKIQEILTSIKAAALAPVMKELTKIFDQFTEKFKDLDGREEIIKQAKDAMMGLFNALRTGFNVLRTLINYFPEIVAGLLTLKIAFFAINAVMMANPIGIVISLVAALVVGFGYLLTRFETLRNAVNLTWQFLKSFGEKVSETLNGIRESFNKMLESVKAMPAQFMEAVNATWDQMQMLAHSVFEFGAKIGNVFKGIGGVILKFMFAPIRSIFALLAKIPRKFLPESVANGIEAVNAKMAALDAQSEPETTGQQQTEPAPQAPQPGDSNYEPAPQAPQPGDSNYEPMRNQAAQSRTETTIRIRSDQPVEIERVQADRNADLNIDTGDLLGAGF